MINKKLNQLEEKIKEIKLEEIQSRNRLKEENRKMKELREKRLNKALTGYTILRDILKIPQIIDYSNSEEIIIPSRLSDYYIEIKRGIMYYNNPHQYRIMHKDSANNLLREDTGDLGYFENLLIAISGLGKERTLDYILDDILGKKNETRLPIMGREGL